MPVLPLPGSAPAALRRPQIALAIGAEPAARWAEHLLECTLECALLPHVDRLRVRLAASGPRPAPDDTGTLALGYEDAGTEDVFSGRVAVLHETLHGVSEVTLAGAAHALAVTRVNASYEGRSAGDVARELAAAAGVSTGTLETGIDLPFVAVDDRRPVLDHLLWLARRSGFVAYLDPSGALQFRAPPATPPVQTFRYGTDVLALRVTSAQGLPGAVTVSGEGAAGSAGQEAWAWLIEDPAAVTSSAGGGTPAWRWSDPALRGARAVQAAAEGALALGGLRAVTGSLSVPGAPAVRVGDRIEIAGAPAGALNGVALVTGVAHRYAKRTGFTSQIRFARAGGGSP